MTRDLLHFNCGHNSQCAIGHEGAIVIDICDSCSAAGLEISGWNIDVRLDGNPIVVTGSVRVGSRVLIPEVRDGVEYVAGADAIAVVQSAAVRPR